MSALKQTQDKAKKPSRSLPSRFTEEKQAEEQITLIRQDRLFLVRNLKPKAAPNKSFDQILNEIGAPRIRKDHVFLLRNLAPVKSVGRSTLDGLLEKSKTLGEINYEIEARYVVVDGKAAKILANDENVEMNLVR